LDEYITIDGAPKPGAGVEGAILAGGRSRRMGRDKLLLPFDAGTMLQAISEALRPLVERLRLIGRESTPGLPLPNAQPDLRPGLGPLSGIHTALATAEADRVLVVAVSDRSRGSTLPWRRPRPTGSWSWHAISRS